MNFLEFCKKKTNNKVGFESVMPTETPERYKRATESMIQIMKNKKDIFDSINVPFVETAFDGDYEEILRDKLPDGEVPDGIICELSFGIFGDYPNHLDTSQQSIIKVLSTYICIQN